MHCYELLACVVLVLSQFPPGGTLAVPTRLLYSCEHCCKYSRGRLVGRSIEQLRAAHRGLASGRTLVLLEIRRS